MKVTKQEYSKMTEKASPNSPIILNCLKAFLFGGGICALGQALLNGFKAMGLDKVSAGSAVSVSLVFWVRRSRRWGFMKNCKARRSGYFSPDYRVCKLCRSAGYRV